MMPSTFFFLFSITQHRYHGAFAMFNFSLFHSYLHELLINKILNSLFLCILFIKIVDLYCSILLWCILLYHISCILRNIFSLFIKLLKHRFPIKQTDHLDTYLVRQISLKFQATLKQHFLPGKSTGLQPNRPIVFSGSLGQNNVAARVA
jgi:hypothetical protein